MKIPYIIPSTELEAFNCPNCDAYAKQVWFQSHIYDSGFHTAPVYLCYCTHCNNYSYWLNGVMIYPIKSNVPLPNSDLPEKVADYYIEASKIVNLSPRAAAALLRLGIEELLVLTLGSGKSINHDIKQLVKDGLSLKIQKALDILRVVGNHAVHAGQINFKDDPQITHNLFGIINLIAYEMITQPKEIDALYETLPENDKENISKRDTK
jgi:hypothetical protein